jgi:trehalose 6-phosphate phosphatase
MKPILGKEGIKLLQKLSQAKTALVFDYDGTLSPIVLNQIEATMRSGTEKYLNEVAELYPTALLSGRKLSDVRARAKCRSLVEVVGNHGIEWKNSTRSRRFYKTVTEWKREILRAIKTGEVDGAGIELEDKKASLSLHYRLAKDHARTRRELTAVLKRLDDAKVLGGKFLYNVLPDAGLNKGTAVVELKKRLRVDYVVFVGDDTTDEDAFALKNKAFLVDVRVGRSSQSKARYFLNNQMAIDPFLEKLIDLRK